MKKNKMDKRGSVLIFVAISLTVLVGFAGLALDIGMTTYKKSLLQNAVDAAALAGAQELDGTVASGNVARSVADRYFKLNVTGVEPVITILEGERKIRVEAKQEINYLFAKVIGFEKGEVNVRAAAIKAAAVTSKTIRPFGIDYNEFASKSENDPIVLRFGAGDGSSGNFGALDFGTKHKDEGYQVGLGADFFQDMILDGSYIYYGEGDQVPTLTGIMAQKTLNAVQELKDNGVNEIIVPLIANVDKSNPNLDLSGKTPVEIVGFISIYIDSAEIVSSKDNKGQGAGSDKKSSGAGQLEIVGHVGTSQTVGRADLNATDRGVMAISLVE